MAASPVIRRRITAGLVAVTACIIILIFSFARLSHRAAGNGLLLTLIMQGIQAVHYSPQPVDDSFSEKVFNEFLKRVDFNKKFFTQTDIEQLDKYKLAIDNEISDSSYAFFDAAMTIYYERLAQAKRYSKLPLESPINFDADETIETDGDKLSYPGDTIAMKDAWRKYMKLQVLQELYQSESRQQKAKEKSDTVKIKSFAQLEADSRAKVKKSNDEFFNRVDELEYSDWMASYLDVISNVQDPHTEYFPPVQKQNFDIQMSGQLEGIGAQLQQRDGEIRISSIVPGSASWRQGTLKAGDVILKVAQGAAEPVNVEGMRLDKAIQLIRGKKGTEVRLTIKKPDGSILVVPIIRDVVIIESTYAQSAIINSNGKKIGYLRLPEFYAPMDRKGGRSSSEDTKKELLKLKDENISGLILDLRDNGGGLLTEAVKLAGLFINEGTIVQVRGRGGKSSALSDNDANVIYNGPLTIMVNENTASASEIVAAAMQDYHRAVIIGSRSTYGKGTVQNFYDLDDFVTSPGHAPLGSVKITIQKYYRVNGGSTQLKGVTPDIILPDPYSEIPYGEKEDQFAIAWDQIAPAQYEEWKPAYRLNDLKAQSNRRVTSNPAFRLIMQEADEFKRRSDNTTYSLSFTKFSEQQKELDAKEKMFDAITSDSTLVKADNLPIDLPKINADTVSVARNVQFIKNLRKDVYVNEAASVVAEMK